MFSLCKQSPWLPFSSPRHCNHIRYSYPLLLGSWHKEMPGSPFKGDVWCGLSDLCVIHWLSSKSISCFFIPFPWFPHPYCLLHVRTCWWQFPCILYWQEADPGHLISCEKKFVRVLTLLEVQNSLSIDPHNPSPSSSSPCLLSAPSSSVRWHVLYMLMETRCGQLPPFCPHPCYQAECCCSSFFVIQRGTRNYGVMAIMEHNRSKQDFPSLGVFLHSSADRPHSWQRDGKCPARRNIKHKASLLLKPADLKTWLN